MKIQQILAGNNFLIHLSGIIERLVYYKATLKVKLGLIFIHIILVFNYKIVHFQS